MPGKVYNFIHYKNVVIIKFIYSYKFIQIPRGSVYVGF